ncbi:MAG: hypothetical protein QXS51_05345 [Thermoproteota archaeon]
MASLRGFKPRRRRETDFAHNPVRGWRRGVLKAPLVMAVILETERSSPGQGEARRKPGGGPKGC